MTDALDRLAFDELLALQLTLAQARAAREQRDGTPRSSPEATQLDEIVGALPFTLTGDQAAAVERGRRPTSPPSEPMRRLLQGDVGSGKTAVAAVALAARCAPGGRRP